LGDPKGKAMNTRITREEAVVYRARWNALRERQTAELRNTSCDEKFRQVQVLHQFARAAGWFETMAEEDRIVWERWRILRERLQK
jgi:hypothetical protein